MLLGTSWWPVHTHNWALADWLMHREEEEWEEERDTGEGVRRGGTSHSAHTYILQAASQPPPPGPRSPSGTSVGPLCAVLPWGTLPTNPEAPGPALRPREESSQQAHVYPSAHLVAQQRPLASSWAGVIY